MLFKQLHVSRRDTLVALLLLLVLPPLSPAAGASPPGAVAAAAGQEAAASAPVESGERAAAWLSAWRARQARVRRWSRINSMKSREARWAMCSVSRAMLPAPLAVSSLDICFRAMPAWGSVGSLGHRCTCTQGVRASQIGSVASIHVTSPGVGGVPRAPLHLHPGHEGVTFWDCGQHTCHKPVGSVGSRGHRYTCEGCGSASLTIWLECWQHQTCTGVRVPLLHSQPPSARLHTMIMEGARCNEVPCCRPPLPWAVMIDTMRLLPLPHPSRSVMGIIPFSTGVAGWARTNSAVSRREWISERRGLRGKAAVLQATAAGALPACKIQQQARLRRVLGAT
jgi:hypothetical protein